MPASTSLELLWGNPQPSTRGPKPSLTLERIVAAAIAHADAEGLANLSMQRLGDRLGCAKMALYRYLPGKAELQALMLDTALGTPPDPAVLDSEIEQPWRAQLRAWALTLFERMCAHPWAHMIAQGVRPMGPNEVGWIEAALAALAGSGLTGPQLLDTVVLLSGHVRSLALQTKTSSGDTTEQAMVRQLARTLADQADRYPRTIAAVTEPSPPGARDNALEFGIDRILDGLATLIAEHIGFPSRGSPAVPPP